MLNKMLSTVFYIHVIDIYTNIIKSICKNSGTKILFLLRLQHISRITAQSMYVMTLTTYMLLNGYHNVLVESIITGMKRSLAAQL